MGDTSTEYIPTGQVGFLDGKPERGFRFRRFDGGGCFACLTFTNLDPAKGYTFSGTSACGGASADRRIGVTLLGADSAEEAREIGDEDPPSLITRTTFPEAALKSAPAALNYDIFVTEVLTVGKGFGGIPAPSCPPNPKTL